jgi:hypothetical protein
MIVRQRLEGEVQYNNGEFAEIQAIGTKKPEKSLLLETIQIWPNQ